MNGEPRKARAGVSDGEGWKAGFDAGLEGKPATPHPAEYDGLSWISGYIEGKAKRQGFKASRD